MLKGNKKGDMFLNMSKTEGVCVCVCAFMRT